MAEKGIEIKKLAVFALGVLMQYHIDNDLRDMVKKFGSTEEATTGTITHIVKEAIKFQKSGLCNEKDFVVMAIEKIMKEETNK